MEILGSLRPPRLPSAGKPASPARGELYFDTDTNVLYWWNGTAWISASGGVSVGAELSYAEKTSNTSVPSTSEAAPNDVVSLPAIDYAAQPVLIEFFAPRVATNVTAHMYLSLWDGSTNLGILADMYVQGTQEVDHPIYLSRRLTPSVGTHTYKIRAFMGGGTGNIYAGAGGAGALLPAFIRISQILPGVPTFVTSLPTSPYDGQEIYYLADAANGVVWYLRYRVAASGSYKWEFVGGAPLYSKVDAAETIPAGSGYRALPTPGPSITVPLAGDYRIEHGSAINSDATGCFAYHSYDIGATGAVDQDTVMGAASWIAGLNVIQSGSRVNQKTLSANTALVSKYNASANTAAFRTRYMSVTPVRVG